MRKRHILERVKLTLTFEELVTIERALCLLHAIIKNLGIKVDPKHADVVERLIKKIDDLPTRVIAGYKAQGYKVNEEVAERLIKSWRQHRRLGEKHYDELSKLIDIVWFWGRRSRQLKI